MLEGKRMILTEENKKLLQLAAKAAGYTLYLYKNDIHKYEQFKIKTNEQWKTWNPLEDNSDVLQLACDLNIEYIFQSPSTILAKESGIKGPVFFKKHSYIVDYVPEEMFNSAYAPDREHASYLVTYRGLIRGKEIAIRKALVCCAAAIGKYIK